MPYTKSGIFYTAKPLGPRKYSAKAQYTRPYTTARGRSMPVAKPAVVVVNKTDGEVKGMDTYILETPIATTNTNGDIRVLNLIEQGSGSWNRVGRKVRYKSLRIQGSVYGSLTPAVTTGNTEETWMRMVIVWDKNPNSGAIPAFDAIFGVTDAGGAESTSVYDPPRFDNMGRFQVLCDKTYRIDFGQVFTAGDTNTVTKYIHVDEFIKLTGKESIFSGQSDPMTIADIASGALYMVLRNYTSALLNIECNTRLRYYD